MEWVWHCTQADLRPAPILQILDMPVKQSYASGISYPSPMVCRRHSYSPERKSQYLKTHIYITALAVSRCRKRGHPALINNIQSSILSCIHSRHIVLFLLISKTMRFSLVLPVFMTGLALARPAVQISEAAQQEQMEEGLKRILRCIPPVSQNQTYCWRSYTDVSCE